MSSPYLGEVRLFSFNFPPKNWALANGQLLGIQQNQALYALLGNAYGGDGQTNFALPNLQGRVAVGAGTVSGTTYSNGNTGGSATVSLTPGQVPVHVHNANGSSASPTIGAPSDNSLPATYATPAYSSTGTTKSTLNPGTVGNGGSGQGHENRQPYLTVSFCIALVGIYPSRP